MERSSLAQRAVHLSATMPRPGAHEGIPFDSGHAFPGVLPDLRAAAELALSEYRAETLQYGVRPGLPELREWISGYLHGEGAEVPAEEVVVVNGAKHGIDLLCRLLLDEGDSIVVTAPTYFTAIPIFKSFGASFIEVSQDEEGLDTSELEAVLARLVREGRRLPKFIYNVPDFHNPTGVTMSRRRREALVELSARHRILILEDSPYRKVRFEGAPEPMIKALDRANTILIGTFAKLIAPGLRIGWVSASTDALARIIQLKSDGGSCPLTQRIIVEFCRAGGLDAHIQSVQRTYGSHRDHMVAAVRRQLPELSMTVPHGGYYLWLKLPEGMDGDELTTRAADAGVTILAGSKFFAGQPQKNYIRLAYSHATPVQIDEGVGRLAGALRSMASTSARA